MSKKTLNAINLETLGPERLAALLIEVSTGHADIKRRLRLELSHSLGVSELARDVGKRLASLRTARSFVGWRKRKALIRDLETQRAMIIDKIATDDATLAFDLLWQFIEIAPAIHARVDDSKGEIADVFRTAAAHFDAISPRIMADPKSVADRVWPALQDNGYGYWDGVVSRVAAALGPDGLAHLKTLAEAHAAAPIETDATEHEALRFLRSLRGGQDYAAQKRNLVVKHCLQEIAKLQGDTSAYLALFTDGDLRQPVVAAEVAQLLCTQGRAAEAMDVLLAADLDQDRGSDDPWDAAYIACLMVLGQPEDAQTHRWQCFCNTLSTQHLRAYLKSLPDFEDVEAEERAMAHVLTVPSFSAALAFCLAWPDLLTAARLILERATEITGEDHDVLVPAAEALRARYPLAAVILWRAMIDATLALDSASADVEAAGYLAECAALDPQIGDYASFETHALYLQRLKARHDRKASFWVAGV